MSKDLWAIIVGGACLSVWSLPMPAQTHGAEVSQAIEHDVSLPLLNMPPLQPKGGPRQKPLLLTHPGQPVTGSPDTAVQTSFGPLVATTPGLSFAGVGNGDYGFAPDAAPPDTNGAVGATQFVQWVNESFAVFDKATGAKVYGPAAGNTLWSGFGGGCQTNNDGDPIVQYDKAAQRWIFTQFSVSTTPYLQCVAVSTTSDATGSYNRYSFQYSNFPDYPKLGVWPDAYYITFNMFQGNFFAGSALCAYDRAAMKAGRAATQQCFQLGSSFGGVLPSDLDGTTPPPAGSPNFLLNFGTNTLNLWKFHVDWTTPANTWLTGPTSIPVASFSEACGGAACIPQSGTAEQLDSLADRLMYRLAYRNFGDHEALVVNHSVGRPSGVRWYELRNPNGVPSVYQQSTFAPDSNYRWMGSIAMDKAGDIALGYSVSSSQIHPAIRFTGRVPTDPLNTMQAESTIINGAGSQLKNLNRWGDYSSMSVDPVDDCTFWYTNEYLKANGTFNWSTWIASFKFPNCGTAPTPDFSLSASPASQTVVQGNGTNFSVTVSPANGFSELVTLSANGVPSGAIASFNTNPIPAGSGSSTMSVTTTSSTPVGTYTLTITGTSGSLTHTANVTLVVSAASSGGFSITALPASQTVILGSGTTYTVTVTASGGFAGSVSLSVTGLPTWTTATFSPAAITNSGSSNMAVSTSPNKKTPPGTYRLTITGLSGSISQSTTVTLVVQ